MPRRDARYEIASDRFAGYRIEHCSPDGPTRLLAETTIRSMAQASAATRRTRLRTDGRRGAVAIVAAPNGVLVAEFPIDPEPESNP